ncbi:FeoA family protein [Candidatus Harpocratesius sp.]
MIQSNLNSHKSKDSTISLADVSLQTWCVVKFINAGTKATRRLTGLGITPGIKIKKLSQAPFRGPVQIEVRNTRLAIGQGLARKIMVEIEKPEVK